MPLKLLCFSAALIGLFLTDLCTHAIGTLQAEEIKARERQVRRHVI